MLVTLRERIGHIFSLLEGIILILITGFTPVYFAWFLRTDDVFELNKLVLFRVLLLAWIVVTALKIYISRERLRTWGGEAKRFFGAYFFPVFLFAAVSSASALFSLDPDTSFFGQAGKYEGLTSLFFYLAFFLLVIYNLRDQARIRLVLRSLAVGSLFVSGYGLAQALGLDPVSWSESTQLRATSTFGQPNILAAYLVLVIPIAGYLALGGKGAGRFFYGAIAFLDILALVFTYSRAGWIAFILSGLLVGFLLVRAYGTASAGGAKQMYIHMYRHMYIHRRAWIAGALALVLVVVGLAQFTGLNRMVGVRMGGLWDWQSGSPSARLDFWSAGMAAVSERPFLGYGLDMQTEALTRQYEQDWALHSNVNVQPMRAHNIILDTWLASGLAGLVALGALWALLFFWIRDNIRSNSSPRLNWAILWSLLGYLIYLMFNFQFVVGHIIFWLFFGLVVVMRSGLIGQTGEIFAESSEAGEQLAFGITNKATGLGRLAGQILGLVAVILVIASAFFLVDREVAKLRADHYFREIRVARYVHEDIFTTYELYDYLKSEPVRQDAYDQGYGVMLAGWVPQIEEYSLTFRPTAEKRVRSIIADAEEPKTYSELVALGQMHTFLGEGGSQEDLKFAREYLEQASRLAPGLPQIYRFLGKVADLSGDMGEGEKYFQKSLAKLPDSADQRMNAKHRGLVKQERHFVYLGLGNMYARAGEIPKAADNYRMALSSIESDHAYGQLAKLYDSDQPEEAINYYKQALSIAPDYSIWPYRIALLYDQLGQKEEAQTYASLALGLNPNNLKYNALAQKLGVNK